MTQELPFEKLERKQLTRKHAVTSEKYGCMPSDRPTSEFIKYGVINLDKPPGPTSHQVSAYVQKILGLDKSGHSGTLDPQVTGCLPIALGRGTKVVQALLTAGKEYVGLMHLHQEVPTNLINGLFKEFTGRIKQLPPIRSSVKREWRYRKIYYLELIEVKNKDVLFKVGCQAGTYVRKLIHDMGQHLKVNAHMVELRRTKAGPFDESTLFTLQDVHDAIWYYKEQNNEQFIKKMIQPIETAVAHLPKVKVLDSTVNTLSHGSDLKVPGISVVDSDIQVGEMIAVMTLKEELICLGTSRMTSKEMAKTEKGVAVTTDKVFMLPGSYPLIRSITE